MLAVEGRSLWKATLAGLAIAAAAAAGRIDPGSGPGTGGDADTAALRGRPIDTAARALRPGDVLLIELQVSGPRGRYVPVEYTGEFGGTSSASPIVAGAAVILEGIARQRGEVIAPAALGDLLRRTGTPQAGDTRKAIGPRPDLERAIRAL